ncbi:C-type lectin domain family 4 member K-like isoform X2 [Macrotis lagotis]|uniref:C-type lectin domain family 4 member K-like isoform X2 n=1 Tax=Macrotis lagotis TaxID=92651 RepID=UPI003D694BB5
MELNRIYENLYQRNTLPQEEKANRKSRIILTVLALLVLVLIVTLPVVTFLYLQKKANMISEGLMWKARFKKVNDSLAALRTQNEMLMQQLSEAYTIYNGSLYYFSCTDKSWAEAEEYCMSQSSHLASVTSVDEQKFLSEKSNVHWHWIGLTRREDKMTFHWTDGTSYDANKTKAFWNSNEPNNLNNNEHCVHLSRKGLTSWNDLNCNSSIKFICKWNCASSGLCNKIRDMELF